MTDVITTGAHDPTALCHVDEHGLTYARTTVTRGLGLALTLTSSVPILHPDAGPKPFSVLENGLGMRFLFVPPGAFIMGSPPQETDPKPHERSHGVTFTKGFFLQTTPVTVGNWRTFAMESGYKTEAETTGALIWSDQGVVFKNGHHWQEPGFEQAEDFPVTCITYRDAAHLARWLRKTDGRLYGLPAEAQWEYGCRAGSDGRYFFGNDEAQLGEYAWFWGNSGNRPHAVARKRPNDWGFYDMLGNVWELCMDHCGLKHEPRGATILSDTYGEGVFLDPLCLQGPFRICRGGDWACLPNSCRPAKRMACSPRSAANIRGLRLAIHLPGYEN